MSDAVLTEKWAPPAPRPVTPTTILARDLDNLCRDITAMHDVPADVVERLTRIRDLAVGLDPYLDACTTAESPALADLARRTHEIDWDAEPFNGRVEQEMLSGHVEGQLLKFLVHLADAHRVLEIGMFTGYSALAMAEALPDGGSVVACELDPDVAAFAQQCFDASPAGSRITVQVGPAMSTLQQLAAESAYEPFDFVFIDADKAGYRGYVDFLLDSDLLTPRAVIAVDNTLMQGQPYLGRADTPPNGVAIEKFNTSIADDPRVEQVLVPLRDGVTLIRRTPSGVR